VNLNSNMADEVVGKGIYDADSTIPVALMNTLAGVDKIYLRQKGTMRECLECLTGCEMSNRYEVTNSDTNEIPWTMKEDSNCCYRQCCGANAPFEMDFYDPSGEKMDFKFDKPYRMTDANCCLPCGFWYWCGCGAEMQMIAGKEEKEIGAVKEQYGTWCCVGKWSAFDDEGNERIRMNTNCCDFLKCCSCSDIDFDLMDKDGNVIGELAKKWVCTCCAVSQQMDHFEVTFDKSVNAEDKLYGVAMAILMKYVYFEETPEPEES